MAERNIDGWLRWEPCGPEVGQSVVAQLARDLPRFFAGINLVRGRTAELPFYESHVLVELGMSRGDTVQTAFVLRGPEQVVWLNGESSPIHETNDDESLHLTDDTVEPYLRFFLMFLRGDSAAFVLIESPEQLQLDGDDEEGCKSLNELRSDVRALTRREGADGGWEFDGSVAYKGTLFNATFAVASNGLVEMIDDDSLGVLEGIRAPKAARLELSVSQPSDREITEALVGALLEEALQYLDDSRRDGGGLLRHFNSGTQSDRPIDQFRRLIEGSNPVVIVTSDIPFVEDFVAGQVAPELLSSGRVVRGQALIETNDDLRCQVPIESSARLYLVSFHTYRALFDLDRVAHELSLSDATVLIGCERIDQVPDALRRTADLVINLPPIGKSRFTRLFERVFQAPPVDAWVESGADWTRYLVATDFHIPRRLDLPPEEAVPFLKDRVRERLEGVSADDGPSLDELHGMGEARRVAEDLIADIQAAQAGACPGPPSTRECFWLVPPEPARRPLLGRLRRRVGSRS